MKGGCGASEYNMKTKSWCSNCRRVSAIMMSAPSLHSSSSSSCTSWRGGNSLMKVAMTLAMVVLLFSIYQSCAPHESSLPVWLSLSFVSRPSFILSSHELSQQPQERPASRLAETLAPIPLDQPDFSSLPPGDVTPFSSGEEESEPSEGEDGDEKTEKRDTFEAHNGNLSGLQRASGATSSGSSVTEKDLPQDSPQRSLHGSNTTGVGSSPVEKDSLVDPVEDSLPGLNSSDLSSSFAGKDEFQESNTIVLSEITSLEGFNLNGSDSYSTSFIEKDEVKENENIAIAETTFKESSKNDQPEEGKISQEDGLEKEQLGAEVSGNWSSQETKPEIDPATSSEEVVLQRDAVNDFATAIAPAVPSIELGLSQAATDASVDTHLVIPSEITEKPMDDRRVKLEQQLHAAKQAIEEATFADSDPSLYYVIYHNVSAFSKSYKLMEEMFKIYVYKDGKPPLVHTGPLLGIYASEGKFLDRISRGSSFIVEDPELAHMYYLPYSVTEMTLTIYVEGSHSMQPLNTFIKDYVDHVAAKYPFWNRTHGADHFFVSCHDWGPATARGHEELRNNAMKVVCNADVNEEYVLGKDASLPEIYLHEYKPVKVGGPGAARRTYLAFFAGQMHGHVRPVLLEHWKDKDPDMKIYEVLPKAVERKMNYVEHMKNSKYCICAAGFEVNSPRIVESIYYDCVPVIIADNFVLPFSDVLNWSTFSVTIPESEIPNLKSILLSISDRQYRAMQKRLSKVRQHFLWNNEPVKYDVYHMIMYSVWMSRLNRLNR